MKIRSLLNTSFLFALICSSSAAYAENWHSGNVQWLFGGSDYKLANRDSANILTLEYAGGWEYGDNFVFVDIFAPGRSGTEVYGEWHPRFSLGKIFDGEEYDHGMLKDILISTEYNYGNSGEVETRILLYGLGFDFHVPGTDWFQFNILAREELDSPNAMSCQISPAWYSSFKIGSSQIVFTGFLDYVFETSDAKWNVLIEPQLLLDCGPFLSLPENRIFVGTEYHYWYNKYGVEGVIDNTFQGMVKWNF